MPDMEQFELDGVIYDVRDPTKAPAGYGLGEIATTLQGNSCNRAVDTGWYQFAADSQNRPEYIYYGVIHTIKRIPMEIKQIAYGVGNISWQDGINAERHSNDGGATWSEWEYDNPPMVAGFEFRTTERWQGKAVYAKLCSLGNLPNDTQKTVADLADHINTLVSADVVVCSGERNFINHPSVTCYVANEYGSRYAVVTTNTDMSAYTANLMLKYTKD